MAADEDGELRLHVGSRERIGLHLDDAVAAFGDAQHQLDPLIVAGANERVVDAQEG